MSVGQAVKESVQRPCDPEIFLDVLFRRAEAACGTEEYVAAVLRSCAEEFRKAGIYDGRLTKRLVATGFMLPEAVGECFGAEA